MVCVRLRRLPRPATKWCRWGANTNRAVDAFWRCRMSRASWAREATEGCGGSVGGGSGRRYATSLSCACGTAISANDRLTSSVLTFGGCRFVRIEHLHPYLYGRFLGFLGCHDENHIKHLHKRTVVSVMSSTRHLDGKWKL